MQPTQTNRGAVSPCLGFWFLNPSAYQVRLHCIIYHVISYSCLAFCLRNHLFYPHIFSCCLEKFLQIFFWGWQIKHVGWMLFCLGISKPLPEDRFDFTSHVRIRFCFFSSLHVFVVFLSIFFQQKKKKCGRRCRIFIFSFDSFIDIVCVFAWYLSSLCIDWICLYIIRVYVWYLLSFPVAS
jgi:hypothetical protein